MFRTLAVNFADDWFPDDEELNNVLQHTLWMALTAQRHGFDNAVALGEAHERDASGGRINDTMADLHNNEQGARLGAALPNVQAHQLAAIIIADIYFESRLACVEPGVTEPC